MSHPFLFLVFHTWKNRVLSRIRKLREPKYLISVLAGLTYLYYIFLRQPFLYRSAVPGTRIAPDHGMILALETGFACMLVCVILFQWFFSNPRTPLFEEPEIQFLFPAPLSRGSLLNYRLAKAQIGIVFGTLVSFVLFGRLFPDRIFVLITIWLVYSLLYLYRISVLMAHQALRRQGAKGSRIKAVIFGVVLLTAVAIMFTAQWIYPPPPQASRATPQILAAWIARIVEHGPIFYFLFPFRVLVRPAFASGYSQFLLRLAPVLVMIFALYLWIRRSRTGFEEAVLGPSEKELNPQPAPGARAARKKRRAPFRLLPTGFPPVAIYWKNLALAGGFSASHTVPALIALTILSILIVGATGESLPMMVGAAAIAMAGFLTIMGPVIFRDDLRTDLREVDLLKSYPIPGWGIVLGEVLGPATVLAILQWALILFAAGVLPTIEAHPWKVSQRIYVAVGAALLLPCLSFIGILVQNAVVMLLPGWMHLGREHQRGVEAMGQRLISGIGTVLSLVIAAIPAALLFVVAWLSGYWLIGVAIVPVASLVAAMGLLVEAAIGILWLGRLFDKFDPSKDL